MANTMVQTKVENRAKHSQNLVFDVQVPKGAFIHNFTMSNAFDMENFKAELNVPSGTKVQFEIHYQEAIRRKLSSYEHIIPVQPGRLTKHLEVNVHIIEPQGISFVHVPNILGEQFTDAATVNKGEKKAHVSFKPSLAQQRKCSNCTTTAVEGSLVVTYDVNRDMKAGELEIFNGYFVHYFAPDDLDPLPKNILFVIDVSGSMWGIKMKQTVEAMKTILGDLRSDDQFSILDFNHNVRCWRDSLVQASKIQTEAAKKYVEGIHPNGGTNINDALLRAMFILNEANALGMLDPSSVSMIILVSDGDPTVGKTWTFKLSFPILQARKKKNLGALTIGHPKPDKPIPAWTQHGSQSALMGPTVATVHTGKRSCICLLMLFIVIGQEPTDNSIPSWVKPTKKSGGPLPAIMGPTSAVDAGRFVSRTLRHSLSFSFPVDNDPHFIITLPRQQKNICFNIDSQPGAILNLISDVESRITVNGKLIGAKRFLRNKLNTYFGKIGFNFEAKGLKVEVSPEAITLKDGSSTTSLSWSETGSLIRRRLLVSVKKESNVTLTLDGDLTFMVLLHRVWKKHPVNVDFLGIYIPPANNFSSSQFMQEPDVVIYNERPGQDPGKSDATMEVKGHKLTVTRGLQKDYRLDRVFGTNVQCWFVHNNGKGFLDGHYRDYLVPNLYSSLKRI
ncbi:Inter-alpha-trypsin inhibitor heavy chain H2, partial [Ophiophagus hannah]